MQTATVSSAMTQAVALHDIRNVLAEADSVVPVDGHIDITGTMALRVRAWVPGLTPSRVVSGSNTLQPLNPDDCPSGGHVHHGTDRHREHRHGGASVRYRSTATTQRKPRRSTPVRSR